MPSDDWAIRHPELVHWLHEWCLAEIIHIPPNYVVERVTAQRKPPEVRICRLRNQSRVGTRPPSTSRMVKIFELAFPPESTPLPSPALRLGFRSTLIHTQRPYGRQRLRGEAMDWKHLLAYITGTVDQELLLRNELSLSR